MKIKNPVIPGMCPDPSVIYDGKSYYLASSTFHWTPGIVVYKSDDLVNWKFYSYILKDGILSLRASNTPTGIWAPHLSYDEKSKKYWIVFSHMVNMGGREFNANNYCAYADSLEGPWSDLIYLTSIGFDPSLYHENGKHYISILEWETRPYYQSPGSIAMCEVDLTSGKMLSDWNRVTKGFTTRGNIEAPQLYKHKDFYYLLLASGGTGYGHGIEIGRSKNIFGPYEKNPTGEPILTSNPRHMFTLGDPDAGHFEMINKNSNIQKSGHGSLVKDKKGNYYIFHLMSRPLEGKILNPLGRETSMQKVKWDENDWLILEDETNLAKEYVEIEVEKETSVNKFDYDFDFTDIDQIDNFMTPYHYRHKSWTSINEDEKCLYIKGRDSLFSQVEPSIMATRATSFSYGFETQISFDPCHYSQTAGFGLYYDNNNWIYCSIMYLEETKSKAIAIQQAKLGERILYYDDMVEVRDEKTNLKLIYDNGYVSFFYKKDNNYEMVIEDIDVEYISDEGVNGEPGEIGGFTGMFNFIGSVDSYQHESEAKFYKYRIINNI